MESTEFQPQKFSQLVLHIARQSEADPRFGIVKLNKILYYSDFNAYRLLGHPITGAQYRKFLEGPAPDEILSVPRTMQDAQSINIKYQSYFNHVQKRILALEKPDTSVFSPREVEIVPEAISALWNMSARQVSNLSRTEIGWKAARQGESIPYQTAWLSSDPIPQEAEEYWREAASSNVR